MKEIREIEQLLNFPLDNFKVSRLVIFHLMLKELKLLLTKSKTDYKSEFLQEIIDYQNFDKAVNGVWNETPNITETYHKLMWDLDEALARITDSKILELLQTTPKATLNIDAFFEYGRTSPGSDIFFRSLKNFKIEYNKMLQVTDDQKHQMLEKYIRFPKNQDLVQYNKNHDGVTIIISNTKDDVVTSKIFVLINWVVHVNRRKIDNKLKIMKSYLESDKVIAQYFWPEEHL